MQNKLYMYTIYCKPSDYPDDYVCRRFTIDKRAKPDFYPTAIGTLEACREAIPNWMVKLETDPKDCPSVVESWV